MYQYRYYLIALCVISACIVRTCSAAEGSSNGGSSGDDDDNSTRTRRFIRKKPLHIESGREHFAGPECNDQMHELCFGVLLPAIKTSQARCSYKEALPAMELAIRKLQQPGGLFERFNITVEYRDTNSSSTFSSLAAVDIYATQSPG